MSAGDIIIIVLLVVGAVLVGLFYLNKYASKKMDTQQSLIEKSKQSVSIFVINKKRAKITEVNLPKAVIENMPKMYKFLKLRFVQAKVGPQILTLMCDKKVYNALTVKKNVRVELAGIYIVKVIGAKTEEELKALKKDKKKKEREKKKES